jgi:riboflavin kinase / FMN adenylyltransferase
VTCVRRDRATAGCETVAPLELGGVVERGDGRGRLLGFPTANLVAAPSTVADGVYAGWALVDGSAEPRAALVAVGVSPTFAGVARRVEAHLLDFSGDLYGRWLRVALVVRLDDVRAYPSCAALTAAIRRHAAAARSALYEEGRPWS